MINVNNFGDEHVEFIVHISTIQITVVSFIKQATRTIGKLLAMFFEK